MSGDPLRVCAVLPKGYVGGAESWLLTLLDSTDRLEVSAVLLDHGPLERELTRRGIPVRVLRVGPRGTDLVRCWAELGRLLRSIDPDVVLGNGVKAQAAVAVPGAVLGVPCVWVKHDHSFDRTLAAPLGVLSARVVTTGDGVADATRRGDVVVIPPPRPAEPLPPSEARALLHDLGAPAGEGPLLAMVSRLSPYKGVDVAIEAIAEPHASAWRLVVMGGEDPDVPGEHRRLTRLARRLGVAERVHLVGHVAAASALLRGVDALAVLTHPTGGRTPGREGAGMSAIEAMVAGVPVIAVDDGGPVARRLAGRAGVLVTTATPRNVASALSELDPRVREAMGSAGQELVADYPDAHDCADKLAAVLAEAAGLPGAGLDGGPGVSVVTTVLNEGPAVGALLDALVPQLRPGDELLVVDGGSTDATAARVSERAERDARVRLVTESGAGIARGRNTGVRLARNELIACTDAGCEPSCDWLDGFRAAGAEADSADLLTGVYSASVRPGSVIEAAWSVVGYPHPAEARRQDLLVRTYGRLFGRTYDPTLPTGRSLAFTRAAWESAGGFPESLQTAEDVLFGRAVVAAGGRAVLVRRASVEWHQRSSLRGTLRMYRSYGRGGGQSGAPLLVSRDLLRAVAYVVGPVALVRGGRRARTGLLVGAAAYLSLPLVRVRRARLGTGVALAVPVAAAVRDVAKAAGCLEGLALRHGSRGGPGR